MKRIYIISAVVVCYGLLAVRGAQVPAERSGDGHSQGAAPQRERPKPAPSDMPLVHNPVMAEQDGRYYLFSTGMGVQVMYSDDMAVWHYSAPVFDTPPRWAVEEVPGYRGHTWAPDIIFRDGRWYLYYSVSTFGSNRSAIGVASNPTLDHEAPEYRWTDHGKVVASVSSDNWNAIDPNIVIDEQGTPWMTFGSFWGGIKLVRLADDMVSLSSPEQWYSLSSREYGNGNKAVEAPFIFQKHGYYYLFVSFDYCCRGENSTYNMVVGRSRNITGPYYDRDGVPMMKGGGTLVVGGDRRWQGVGHNSAYTFSGQDYLIFHGYDGADKGRSKLLIRQIEWDRELWPTVEL